MKLCIPALCRADEAHVLPGWEKPRGACWEVRIARMLGIAVRNAITYN